MTVYGLMDILTSSCAASASFGEVHLWWSEKQGQLFLSKRPPLALDAECLDMPSLGRPREKPQAVDAVRTPTEHAVSSRAAEAVRSLIPVARRYLGSVDGRLETISIHGKQRFIIYHSRTNKAVTCHFSDPNMIPDIAGMLGRRVLASGQIESNIKGEPARLSVEDIRVIGKQQLPTTAELAGSHPDITDGMTTDEYIRSIRE